MANSTIPYVQAVCVAEDSGMLPQFLQDYGPEESWICPETGDRIRVDHGEFMVWLKGQV